MVDSLVHLLARAWIADEVIDVGLQQRRRRSEKRWLCLESE